MRRNIKSGMLRVLTSFFEDEEAMEEANFEAIRYMTEFGVVKLFASFETRFKRADRSRREISGGSGGQRERFFVFRVRQ